ncbi:MAG: type II secretion system protein [Planctomycetes bacterium]|nr:type II secretion system protein [Planctomycetota bacterium]
MNWNKGFTLIELMVVILIVAILAAVAIPIMRGRIDAAKWSEGKAMAGTLGTAIRAYFAEKGPDGDDGSGSPDLTALGFASSDLTGTYFDSGDYDWTTTYDDTGDPALEFTITVTAPTGITTPSEVQLNHLGEWTETE